MLLQRASSYNEMASGIAKAKARGMGVRRFCQILTSKQSVSPGKDCSSKSSLKGYFSASFSRISSVIFSGFGFFSGFHLLAV